MLTQIYVTWRHQAITWANVDPDLCRLMASLGLNELTESAAMTSAATAMIKHGSYMSMEAVVRGLIQHIKAETRWLPISWQHLNIFLNENIWI